ncbi:MAG: dirigent protein [Actinobacteria bacterium]|nr:dirigent protein [Actinomycetota bacterium]
MTKRSIGLLLALALAAAAVLAVPAAGAAGAGETISVIEHPVTDTTTDVGKKGDSLGDILTFHNPIFDGKDAKQVASDQGYCIRVDVGVSYECTWTNFLKGGQIVVQGPYYDAKPSELAITGGTGKYATARGWMHLEAIEGAKGEEEFSFVFHLR